jgi:hypothetical protein
VLIDCHMVMLIRGNIVMVAHNIDVAIQKRSQVHLLRGQCPFFINGQMPFVGDRVQKVYCNFPFQLVGCFVMGPP